MTAIENIREAARVINPVFINTPQYESDSLNEALGFRLLLKVECVNPIRSFKGRGTDYLYHKLEDRPGPLVTASAGNFGQGMAFAARQRDQRVIVFAASIANRLKVARMKSLGAEVILKGQDFDAAKDFARTYALQNGLRFIEDGRESAIAEGAGSIAVEILRSGTAVDKILVPVGNGALICGIGTWFKTESPLTRIVGIVASGAPAMLSSWRDNRIVATDTANTIADGIAVRVPVPEALDEMRTVVDEMTAVDDERILQAMELAREHLGITLEPAGAAGLAAAVELRGSLADSVVATILCGSNVEAGLTKK